MPSAPPALYLDEDVSIVVAAILRARGFEVMSARDATQLSRSDVEQLEFAAAAGRILFTHNRVDFERLQRESHGGSIWVKSQVGVGSTFAFTIPLGT